MERTLVILKPDACERRLIGALVTRLEEQAGLKIEECGLTLAPRSKMNEHYDDLGRKYGEDVKAQVVDFMCSGPILVMIVSGEDAVGRVRRLIGSTDPAQAGAGTIRGDFGDDSMAAARQERRCVRNLIHASDSVQTAEDEIGTWFAGGRLPLVDFEGFIAYRSA